MGSDLLSIYSIHYSAYHFSYELGIIMTVSITPKTYVNVNSDGNGGFYIWIIQEINSLDHVVESKLDSCERTVDNKWIFLHKCEHVWTDDQLISELNMRTKIYHNLHLTKSFERDL
jgi:hypothetical protein